jgi:acetyl esterase/lipase
VDNVNDSLAYYTALRNAGVPVEMHLYAQGAQAFGLRCTKLPVTVWPQLVETWLGTIGMISKWHGVCYARSELPAMSDLR